MRYKLLASLAAALFAAGAAIAQEPIKIGAFLSVTGGAAFLGGPVVVLAEHPRGLDADAVGLG